MASPRLGEDECPLPRGVTEFWKDEQYDQSCRFFRPEKHELLVYTPFNQDFGPPHLGALTCFCRIVDHLLRRCEEDGKKLVVVASYTRESIANTVLLLSAYLLLYKGLSVDEVLEPTKTLFPPLARYRDAGYTPSEFEVTVRDVLMGLHKGAVQNNWYDPETFNIDRYVELESPAGADLNVVVPGRILMFGSPGRFREIPFYVECFRTHFGKVSAVARFNRPLYNGSSWAEYGVNFRDLYFMDGTTPSASILHRFLRLYDETEGVIAVHCRSGLGRAGCMIGIVLMRDYDFSAREAIGWIRLCRPGSVLGIQQQWLASRELDIRARGRELRKIRQRSATASVSEPSSSTRKYATRTAPNPARLLMRRKKLLGGGISPSPSASKRRRRRRAQAADLVGLEFRDVVLKVRGE